MRIRFIYISLNYWTICRSFAIILEKKLSTGLEFESNVLCKSMLQKKKNSQSDMNYLKKC